MKVQQERDKRIAADDGELRGGHFRRRSATDDVRQVEPPADAHGVPDKLVLTIEEVAACLGISRAFAYELANRREIPTVRLGRRILVPREQLLAFVVGATVLPHRQ